MRARVAKHLRYPARVVTSRPVLVYRGDATPSKPVVEICIPVGTTGTVRKFRRADYDSRYRSAASLVVHFDGARLGLFDVVDIRLLEPLPGEP